MSEPTQIALDLEPEAEPEQPQPSLLSLLSIGDLSDRDLVLLAGALLAEIRRRRLPFDDDN